MSTFLKKLDVSTFSQKLDVSTFSQKLDVSTFAQKLDVSTFFEKLDVSSRRRNPDILQGGGGHTRKRRCLEDVGPPVYDRGRLDATADPKARLQAQEPQPATPKKTMSSRR